jgi:hypothetical protein
MSLSTPLLSKCYPSCYRWRCKTDDSERNTYWNYTAYAVSSYNQFVAPLLNFTMQPTEIWGVA